MKTTRLFPFFCMLFFSCELFNGPKVDLFKKISDEVDWANAKPLAVKVFTGVWGKSTQEAGCLDAVRTKENARAGYPFNVDFLPSSEYGFEQWLAFPSAGFAEWFDENKSRSPYDEDEIVISRALNDKGVTIKDGKDNDVGAKTARVTISIQEPVTLVPWCSERPRIIESKPPVISLSGKTYPRGQNITMYFNIDLDPDTVRFGEGFIELGGQKENEHGEIELYEDMRRHFEKPYYNDKTITILAKTGAADLPPENATITVRVGTGQAVSKADKC